MNNQKRVLGVIDHFGSGGSQRQFVHLMNGLANKGYDVSIFTYHASQNFFRGEIDESNIRIFSTEKKSIGWPGVIRTFVSIIKEVQPAFVISFLHIPNLLCEVAGFLTKIRFLVVSERSSRHYDRNLVIGYIRRLLHRRASKVVVNSKEHELWIKKKFPFLGDRIVCIYNGVDPNFFDVSESIHAGKNVRFVGVGRVDSDKNPMFLVKALIVFSKKNGWCPSVEWIGRVGHRKKDQRYFEGINKLINSNDNVKASWKWRGESKEIVKVLEEFNVLIHPSRYEGLPNVVCESLAMGRPVLASRVCEHPHLVGENAERGFLFNLDDPKSLSNKMEKITSMDLIEWEKLTWRCRAYAKNNFRLQKMVDSFENIIRNE